MSDSPRIPDGPPLRAQVALVVGIALGAWTLSGMIQTRMDFLMMNLEVYYYASDAVLSGRVGDLYAVTPPGHEGYRFVYPPLAVAGFLPLALFPSPPAAFAVHTLFQVGLGLTLAGLLVRAIERRGRTLGRIDRVLVAGFAVASVHSVPTLFFGNVNLALALALGVALEYGERRPRLAGVALAVPAVLKAFPAALGVWWVRRRAWRPAAVAAGIAGAFGVASLALFGPALHRTYLRDALLDRVDPSLYAGGMAPGAPMVTVRRPLSVLFPTVPSWAIAVGAALLLGPVVAATYTRIDSPVDRLVAMYATVAAVLLFFPSYFVYLVYLFYPTVVLLYLLKGRSGQLFAAGVAVASLAFSPAVTLELLAGLPAPLADLATTTLRPAVVFASPALYGLGITLAACLHHRFTRPVPDGEGSRIPGIGIR